MGDVLFGVYKVEDKTVILLITSGLPWISVGGWLVNHIGGLLSVCHSFSITFNKVLAGLARARRTPTQGLNVGVKIFPWLTGGAGGLQVLQLAPITWRNTRGRLYWVQYHRRSISVRCWGFQNIFWMNFLVDEVLTLKKENGLEIYLIIIVFFLFKYLSIFFPTFNGNKDRILFND